MKHYWQNPCRFWKYDLSCSIMLYPKGYIKSSANILFYCLTLWDFPLRHDFITTALNCYLFMSLVCVCVCFIMFFLWILTKYPALFPAPGRSCRGTRTETSVSSSLSASPTHVQPARPSTTRDSSIRARFEYITSTNISTWRLNTGLWNSSKLS